jgi:hypothetical protein
LAVSSIDAGRSASGVTPTCESSVTRRGLALARTRRGRSTSAFDVARSRALDRRTVSRPGEPVRANAGSRLVFSDDIMGGLEMRSVSIAKKRCADNGQGFRL